MLVLLCIQIYLLSLLSVIPINCKDVLSDPLTRTDVLQQHFTLVATEPIEVNDASIVIPNIIPTESVPNGQQGSLYTPPAIHFEDFPVHHEQPLNLARSGMSDAFRLAEAAIRALESDTLSSSYYRYFQEQDRDRVLAAFETILRRSVSNEDTNMQTTDNNTIEDLENTVTIWWDDPLHGPTHCHDNIRANNIGITAYFLFDLSTQFSSESAWNIVLCPTILDITSSNLDDIPCSALKAYATQSDMESPGRILLHEMFHAPSVAVAAGVAPRRGQIQDYQIFIGDDDDNGDDNDSNATDKPASGCRFQDLKDGDIIPAYGPFWSHFVNENQKYGTWERGQLCVVCDGGILQGEMWN